MKNQEPKKPQPDDLAAFVDAYFSRLTFAAHVTPEIQRFIKGHLNAFALVMRAKYRPTIVVAESSIDLQAFEMDFNKKPGRVVVMPQGEADNSPYDTATALRNAGLL